MSLVKHALPPPSSAHLGRCGLSRCMYAADNHHTGRERALVEIDGISPGVFQYWMERADIRGSSYDLFQTYIHMIGWSAQLTGASRFYSSFWRTRRKRDHPNGSNGSRRRGKS